MNKEAATLGCCCRAGSVEEAVRCGGLADIKVQRIKVSPSNVVAKFARQYPECHQTLH